MRFLGSKQLLLSHIEQFLKEHIDGDENTFLDLFAGTNVVGQYFKKDYTIFSNDILFFSYVNARATIENNKALKFTGLQAIGIENPLVYLQENANRLKKAKSNYYEEAYTPSGGSMYFSVENGKRIDFIRGILDEWNNDYLITDGEYYYLLSTLIEAIPYVSNTTGTYGAYLKYWDKRAEKCLNLEPLEIIDNGRENKAYNEDANKLVKKINADIVYIDTPYNNRQYASNYHVLENIARHTMPTLKGKTKIFDWKNLKSVYSIQSKALQSMEDLIKNIDAKHVIVSYNDEGIVSLDDLILLLEKYSIDGLVDVRFIDYRKYTSKIRSKKTKVREVLIYIRKKAATPIKYQANPLTLFIS